MWHALFSWSYFTCVHKYLYLVIILLLTWGSHVVVPMALGVLGVVLISIIYVWRDTTCCNRVEFFSIVYFASDNMALSWLRPPIFNWLLENPVSIVSG